MILVADDNHLISGILRDICCGLDVGITVVTSGEDAVASAAIHVYAVIIMDLHLDGMDGVNAAIMIRTLPEPFRSTPIVALSGLHPVAGMTQWDQAEFCDTLVKPFSVKDVIEVIRKYVPALH